MASMSPARSEVEGRHELALAQLPRRAVGEVQDILVVHPKRGGIAGVLRAGARRPLMRSKSLGS